MPNPTSAALAHSRPRKLPTTGYYPNAAAQQQQPQKFYADHANDAFSDSQRQENPFQVQNNMRTWTTGWGSDKDHTGRSKVG
jgi:hypothetical protein